jgi:acyl-coenzyme A synthetase/AMP-(fatty) acid ligase
MYEVSPSVLESRLLSHHSVVDAAVIGIPDKEPAQHE